MTTSWLVTGARGQLGQELVALLGARGDQVLAAGRDLMDLTNEESVRGAVRSWLSGAVADRVVLVNAAAYTAVDAAEDDEDTAATVNGLAPGWMAEEMAGRGRLVHVSTDYVFSGDGTVPYGTDEPVAPRSVYGRTKAAGELAVSVAGGDAVTVRTSWVFGAHGGNFVATMLRLEGERPTVSVVDDQRGSPTWAADLAAGLMAVGESDVNGVVHCTNGGSTTWCGLAREVFRVAGADPQRVLATTSAEFVRSAPRPAYSVLDGASWVEAGLPPMRRWEEAVRLAVPGM